MSEQSQGAVILMVMGLSATALVLSAVILTVHAWLYVRSRVADEENDK